MEERNPELYHLPENCIFLISQKALIVKDQKFLLLKFIRLDGSEGEWELPGGLKNWGEDSEIGLRREVNEETALCVIDTKLFAVSSFPHKDFFLEGLGNRDADIYTSFYVCNVKDSDIKLSHEHSLFMWASAGEIEALELTESAKFAIDAYLGQSR